MAKEAGGIGIFIRSKITREVPGHLQAVKVIATKATCFDHIDLNACKAQNILEERFHKGEILFILFGRHLIGLRAQIFIVSGIMRMHPLKFLITDAFSSLFTIALMVGAGYAGGNSLQVLKKDITKVEHIAILLIIVLIVIFIFFKLYRFRHDKDARVKT